MDTKTRAQALTAAVIEQLNAEIGASPLTVKSLAAEMNADYNTFRRYVIGERPLPMQVLWEALDALEVDDQVFMKRARDRFESS